jgi:hypothetical protein
MTSDDKTCIHNDPSVFDRSSFLDDDGPYPVPPFITRTNAIELFGMEEGETVPEAIARHQASEG